MDWTKLRFGFPQEFGLWGILLLLSGEVTLDLVLYLSATLSSLYICTKTEKKKYKILIIININNNYSIFIWWLTAKTPGDQNSRSAAKNCRSRLYSHQRSQCNALCVHESWMWVWERDVCHYSVVIHAWCGVGPHCTWVGDGWTVHAGALVNESFMHTSTEFSRARWGLHVKITIIHSSLAYEKYMTTLLTWLVVC